MWSHSYEPTSANSILYNIKFLLLYGGSFLSYNCNYSSFLLRYTQIEL